MTQHFLIHCQDPVRLPASPQVASPSPPIAARCARTGRAMPIRHPGSSRVLAQYEVSGYTWGMESVSQTLRHELERCGQTRYAVSKATGIPESVLSRFVHGQPLRGTTFDKLAEYLGLVLIKQPTAARRER